MQRLIDADAVISGVKNRCIGQNDVVKVEHSIISMLYMMPTIDAEPVKHGKWIFNPSDAFEAMFAKPKCSECGFESADGLNYCPNCGARMDADALTKYDRKAIDEEIERAWEYAETD